MLRSVVEPQTGDSSARQMRQYVFGLLSAMLVVSWTARSAAPTIGR
jgi:hypothetical protein